MIRKVIDKARLRVHDLYQTDVLDFAAMCTAFDLLNEVEEGLRGSEGSTK